MTTSVQGCWSNELLRPVECEEWHPLISHDTAVLESDLYKLKTNRKGLAHYGCPQIKQHDNLYTECGAPYLPEHCRLKLTCLLHLLCR
jgi:hypothetical protein